MMFHAIFNPAENYVSPRSLRCVNFYLDGHAVPYDFVFFFPCSIIFFIIISFW